MGGTAGLAAAAICPGFTILICAPIFMFGGGVAGAGAMVLADDAANRGPDPVTGLQQMLSRFAGEQLEQQLLSAVREKASVHWRVVPISDETSMTLQLAALSLRGDSLERLSLTVHVTARVQSREVTLHPPRVMASGDPKVGDKAELPAGSGRAVLTQSFFYDGPTADVSQWMDESNTLLKSAIATAYEAIAQQIVGAIAGEGRPVF